VGSIPSLVLGRLSDKKNLYLHTECLFGSAADLIKCGAAKGATCTLAMGDKDLVDYVDDNSDVLFLPVDVVNDSHEIELKNMYAINSAISVDSFGQAACDYIGDQIYSGFGGIVDFMRGASCSDGLAILAMTSKTKNGRSKFCNQLSSPVTLTRADIDVVVTEIGTVDLRGANVDQRNKLIREVFNT
jgi:acyl-CoA hydrolase